MTGRVAAQKKCQLWENTKDMTFVIQQRKREDMRQHWEMVSQTVSSYSLRVTFTHQESAPRAELSSTGVVLRPPAPVVDEPA